MMNVLTEGSVRKREQLLADLVRDDRWRVDAPGWPCTFYLFQSGVFIPASLKQVFVFVRAVARGYDLPLKDVEILALLRAAAQAVQPLSEIEFMQPLNAAPINRAHWSEEPDNDYTDYRRRRDREAA